jgi:hypothetical protein
LKASARLSGDQAALKGCAGPTRRPGSRLDLGSQAGCFARRASWTGGSTLIRDEARVVSEGLVLGRPIGFRRVHLDPPTYFGSDLRCDRADEIGGGVRRRRPHVHAQPGRADLRTQVRVPFDHSNVSEDGEVLVRGLQTTVPQQQLPVRVCLVGGHVGQRDDLRGACRVGRAGT